LEILYNEFESSQNCNWRRSYWSNWLRSWPVEMEFEKAFAEQ
jgi:hypothetical protein